MLINKTIAINKDCNPAKGTVLSFNPDFKIRNKIKEKIKEVENKVKNVIIGKLQAKKTKKKASPKPMVSDNFIFILNFAYTYSVKNTAKMTNKFTLILISKRVILAFKANKLNPNKIAETKSKTTTCRSLKS